MELDISKYVQKFNLELDGKRYPYTVEYFDDKGTLGVRLTEHNPQSGQYTFSIKVNNNKVRGLKEDEFALLDEVYGGILVNNGITYPSTKTIIDSGKIINILKLREIYDIDINEDMFRSENTYRLGQIVLDIIDDSPWGDDEFFKLSLKEKRKLIVEVAETAEEAIENKTYEIVREVFSEMKERINNTVNVK